MAFINTELPPQILLGSSFGPSWDVEIVQYGQGDEFVNRKINQSRYTFSLRHVVERSALFADVVQFFNAIGGPATGFLVDNPIDNKTNMAGSNTATDISLGDGDGSTTTFNLVRTYTHGAVSTSRRIFKPKNDILVAVDGTPLTVVYDSVPASGEVSVDSGTGVLTFETAPGDGLAVTWGGGYYCPVRLNGDMLDISAPDAWYELNASLIELLNPSA